VPNLKIWKILQINSRQRGNLPPFNSQIFFSLESYEQLLAFVALDDSGFLCGWHSDSNGKSPFIERRCEFSCVAGDNDSTL